MVLLLLTANTSLPAPIHSILCKCVIHIVAEIYFLSMSGLSYTILINYINPLGIYHRRTLLINEIIDHSDVVGASPVDAAPTTSSFSTSHLAGYYIFFL